MMDRFLPKINILYKRHKDNETLFFNPEYITEAELQTALTDWLNLAEDIRNYAKNRGKGLK